MDTTGVISSLLTAVAASAVLGFAVKNSRQTPHHDKPLPAPPVDTANTGLIQQLRQVQSALLGLQRPYGGAAAEFILSDEQKQIQKLQAHEAEIKRLMASEHLKLN